MKNLQIIIDYLKESERTHFEEDPCKEHIFVKTVLAGQELRKLKDVTNTENKLAEISQNISWDNWTKEDKPDEFWKVTEVLFCQLSWILEEAELSDEHKEILQSTQILIESMSKDDYKNN